MIINDQSALVHNAQDALAALMADQVLPDVLGAVLAMHSAGRWAGLPAGWYLDTLDAWCDAEGAARALERIATTDWEMDYKSGEALNPLT